MRNICKQYLHVGPSLITINGSKPKFMVIMLGVTSSEALIAEPVRVCIQSGKETLNNLSTNLQRNVNSKILHLSHK